MTAFANRLAQAHTREQQFATVLEERGWTVWNWEPIPKSARDTLINLGVKHPLRWWPDLFAIKGTSAALFDVKGVLAPNATIEADAAWTYQQISHISHVLLFWINQQGEWVGCTIPTLTEYTKGNPLPGTGNGSGTPWYLIPATALSPIDDLIQSKEAPKGPNA